MKQHGQYSSFHVEIWSEKMLQQHSYVIKNRLRNLLPCADSIWHGSDPYAKECPNGVELVLYGIGEVA